MSAVVIASIGAFPFLAVFGWWVAWNLRQDAIERKSLTPPPWVIEEQNRVQTDRKKKTLKNYNLDLPGVYKDDVDLANAISHIERMGKDLSLGSEEIKQMVEGLTAQVEAMPEKPPEANDACPECGEMFAMVDDYLCPSCRAKA